MENERLFQMDPFFNKNRAPARRVYNEDFKRSMVEKLYQSGKSVNEFAKCANINRVNLQKWKQRYGPENKSAGLEDSKEHLSQKMAKLTKEMADIKETVYHLRNVVRRSLILKYMDSPEDQP